MAKDNLSSLYNGLISKGYSTDEIGDETTFRSKMADKNNRKQLYDYVSARKDFRIGDYETYENRLSGQPEQTETEQEPQEVEQKPLPKAERKTLQEQAGMNIAVPDAIDMAAKFAEGQTYDPNANIQKALARGELDTIINQDEEQRISTEFTPKPVVEASDIYKNYYDRFGLTERGKQLSGELATIQEGVQKKYADEFLASDDYKKLSETYTGAELDEAANTLFAEKYSNKIEEELKPYYDAYQTEALSRYQNEIGQEFEQFQKAQTAKTKDEIASDVSSLSSSISQQKEDIHNRLTAKAGTGGNAMSAIMGSRKYIQETEADRKAQAELDAAQQLMDESNNIIAEAKKKGKTNFVAGLGRGLSDATFDANTWSFGLQELRDNTLLLNALDKYDNGEQLTESEQTLMDAAVANMATNAYFYSDLGRGYKAGTVSGQSIPFMLEFAINPVSASGSAIAKSILKYGMQKFGKSAVKNNASKFAARLIGDMAAAGLMTGTTSAARVGAGAVERMTGDIQLDDTGIGYAGRENVMSAGEAIGKSAASTFLENQSEMVFNAFKGLGNKIWKTVENQMPGGIAGVMDNAILGKVGDIYRKAKSNPVLQEVARRTQFHGLAEEYLEEVYNNFANIPLGEMTLEEATDLDNNIDTFLGLAPTSVAFAALGLGGLAVEKNEHRKRIKAALGNLSRIESKRLAELERMAETAGNEDIKRFIRETITSTELTPEEKKAEIDYAYNLAVGNAIDQLETEQKNETLDSHAAATEEGRAIYAEHNPQTMRETVLRREIAEQRLAATGMTQDDISVLANTPVEERYNAISSFDTDRRKAAEDYFAAKDRETALNDALDEAHAEEVTQARELLDSITLPNGTVTIVPLGASAISDTEYGVVVSGINADGSPMLSNGEVMVYPVKLNNGQLDVDFQTPMTIVPKSYTDAVIYSPDEALENMLKSYSDDAAILDGIPMTVGAQFPIMDDNGMMSNVTILGTDEQNGRYIVSLNDQIDKNGVPKNTYIDAAELAERKKNAELAPFMQEQIAEEQQRMEAEHEAITTDLAPQVANLQPQPGEKIMIAGKQAAIKEIAPDGLIVDYINESGDITSTDIVPLDAYYNYKQEQFNAQENERQNISDVSEQSGNVNDTEKNAGKQSPEPQGKTQQPYPTDERGEPAFTQMQPEQTVSLLTSTLNDDAASFVADKLSAAEKNAKKAAEKKPKSLSFTERVSELGKIAEERAQAESELQYWQNISAMMNVQPAQPTAKKEEPKKPQPQAKSITEEAEEITRKNQERLAAMTEEEIAAAQKKVQENIDKGKYERPTQRKRTRYVEQDKELGYAVTPYEHVLREIATGAITFQWGGSKLGNTQGLGSHLGLSGSNAERQKLIWTLSSDGYAPEVAAEIIHANMPENLQGMVTDQDVFNMILDAFGTYGSPSKMFEAAKEMHGTDEISMQRGYEEDMERQALEWEAEQNKMSVNDWTTYLDVVEDVVEMKFGTLSDEDINTIFDGIINEINNENGRGETEGRSSETTEQSGDTETGNEVLSGQQADITTADTESAGQEQQAETDEQSGSTLSHQGFTVEKRYHKKDNKDIFAVNFTERMDRDIFLDAKREAKNKGGYYSSFGKGGFIFETEETARNFGELIMAGIVGRNVGKAIEAARAQVEPNPTEAQKEAGNYKKGHVTVDGYNITLENPKGSERSGTDKDGKAWSVTMNNDYGYIRGTEGVDGDHIDVFLSDTPESGNVYVVDQVNEDGSFDEHKVMYGFETSAEAEEAYLANYSPGWDGLGNITEVTKEQFKKWIESSHRKTKPFAEYSMNLEAAKEAALRKEGREPYYIPLRDSWGQYDGRFYKVWLMPEDIDNESGYKTYRGLSLWTLEQAWHSEEGFGGVSKTFYNKDELNEALDKKSIEKVDTKSTNTVNGYKKGDKVMYQGKPATIHDFEYDGRPVLDTGLAPVLYEVVDWETVSLIPETTAKTSQTPIQAKKELLDSKIKKRQQELDDILSGRTEDFVYGNGGHRSDLLRSKIGEWERDKRNLEVLEALKFDVPYEGENGMVFTIISEENGEYKYKVDSEGYSLDMSTDLNGMISTINRYNLRPDRIAQQSQKPQKGKKTGTAKTTTAKDKEIKETPAYGSQNKVVSTARYEELKKRMRAKLNNLNAGYDPELIAIGAEMAAYHVEAGARKFVDFAKRMISDIGEDIRPYLKLLYNSARDFPGMEEYKKSMTPYEEVDKMNINNIKLTEDEQTAASTQAIVDEAEAIASEAETDADRTAEETKQLIEKIDNQVEEINKQLALLGYYEADTNSPFHEIYGYARSAEKKAVADVKTFAKKLVKDLGVGDIKGKNKLVYANIPPAGGDIYVHIPLLNDKELVMFIPIKIERDTDNMRIDAPIMYRVEDNSPEKSGQARYGTNWYINEKSTYPELLKAVRSIAKQDLPEQKTETKPTSPVKKASAKGNMQKTDNAEDFGDLFSGLNEVSLQTETLNRTDNEQERGSETENTGVGEKARQEDGRADRSGMDSGSTGSVGTEQPGSGRNAGIPSGKSTGSTAGKTEPQIKNTRNNRNERGIDYAPRSPKARYAANVKAIKLMRQLMNSGEQPTREQMEVLRRYSGWGGMGTYFNNTDTEENKQLRELLTDEEYDAAANSGNSAYYTPAQITDSLWDIVEKLGFKGGNILEGSAGIGNILGAMPQSISEKSNIHAVEIDKTSGNILSLLYPDAKVDIQGFEDTRIRNGSVDLAITNVPFVADLTVYDKIDKDLSAKFPKIQDFCIAKNVRKLREGGLGVFITSSITMDNSANLREWLVNEGNADFIGAFRLNNKTFEGADVTTDIIVVRKRTGKKVSPVAIDALKSTVERTGSYETKETEWNKKERRWEPVKKDVVLEYNAYYQQHPENMGGEMFFGYEKGNTYRPGTQGLYPVAGKNQNELLKNWVNSFTPIMDASYQPQQVQEVETEEKNGTLFADKEGNFFISDMGVGVPLNLNANKIKGYDKTECLNDYNAIKTSLNDVLEYQINNQDDKGLQPLLDKLNEAYDTFVGKYGSLNKNTAISFLKNDVDFPSIAALEDYKEYKNAQEEKVIDIRKTNVFDGRVIGFQTEPEPKDVKDGVIASIYKNGYIDVPYIAEKLGKSVEQVEAEILKEKIGFVNPVSGAIEVRYEYLSGNVRQKLEEAKANNTNGEYNTNITELEKVIPMDIPAHLIDFSLGSSWIDPKLYIEYIQDRYGVSGVSLNHVEGAWNLIVRGGVFNEKNRAAGVYSEMFKETIYATDLVAAALNNRTVQVKKVIKGDKTKETLYDREATQTCVQRIEEIKDDFKEWMRNRLQQDEELAAQVTRTYNDKFNNMVPKEIDDMFLPERFGGASQFVNLYTHQKRAVIKGTTQPLLLAHEVGSGKTFTLISTAMEMRRLGTAKKPMIVVQNATVAQFVADAKKVYPNAKVLTITERDRTPEGRREFYGRIKYSDWDMIIIPQSTFEMIPDSPERQLTFIQERIEEKQHAIEMMQETGVDENQLMQAERELENIQIEMAKLTERLRSGEGPAPKTKKKDAKREEKVKQNVAARAKKQLDRRTDEVQYFDEMGVDAILIDEAHEYKRLGFSTAMTRGVKGIDPAGSKKAAGVYLKTRAVLEKNGWKNVVFATGTPISNTAAEIWTFMRYLMPKDVLKANEIYYFDDFVRNFGSISQSLEFTTSGKFKENTRFASYINKPELIRLWATVSDTVLTKEIGYVNSKIPSLEKGIHQDVFLPQSDSLISIMNAVRARLEEFEKMSGKEKRKNSHIPLTMYGIAKRAAIDTRLVDANAPDEPLSKTNKAVEETLKSLEETKDYKGTVAIFCDNQRRWDGPRVGFDLFEDIKTKLIEKGVSENQIVIMKPGMSIQKKQKIFDDVNAGTVRVVIGNTQTLGTGVNIQERLHTLIHMDAPDRPMDYTQRNGRILRQGNLHKVWNKPVRILRFGVEDSLDVTSYQRLKTKAAFIDSIMDGKSALANNQENRTLEEEEEGLFDNPVAILSGSQYALLKNAAERELRKYVNNKKRWEADQIYVVNRLARNKGLTVKAQQSIDENEQQLAKVKALFPDGKVNTLTYNKKKLTTAESVDEAFKEINKAVKAMDETARKDRYFPDTTLPFEMELDGNKLVMKVTLSRSEEYDYKQKATLIKVRRSLSFDMPAMGIKDYSVMGAYARNILEYVEENIVTGTEFTDVIEVQQASIEAMAEESKLLEQRKGKPFEFDKELEEAQKKVDEYTELMKAEMKEKEAKYAGRGSKNVDLSTVESEEEQDEAQAEDEVRFRIEDEAEPGKFTEEEQSIIDEAKSNGTYMKAPNGKPTNLNEKQWAQVRTKAFKDWFGDWENSPESASKVVDENGEPMIAYHGGPAGITQFVNPKDIDKKYAGRHSAVLNRKNQMGIYFIDKKSVAEQYAETYGKKRNIYPVFINARNIQDINQPQFYGLQFLKNIAKLWNKDFINYQDIKESDVERLQSVGVDGLSAKSWDKSREFVVFNSNQIKSATENVGTFSNENNDMRFRTIDDVQENELSDKLSRLIYRTPVKSNPLYNVNNVNLELYSISGPYMRRLPKPGERRVLTEGNIDIEHAKNIYKKIRPVLNELRKELLSMIPDATIAARKEIASYIHAIDNNISYYKELSEGKDVWRTRPLYRFVQEQQEASRYQPVIDAIQAEAGKLGIKVNVYTSMDEVPAGAARRAIEKGLRVKGWYQNGQINIYLPNAAGMEDVKATLLHEGVAHYGLRQLVGEQNVNEFIGKLYAQASKEVRENVMKLAPKYGYNIYEAMEEYIASMAEKGIDNPTFWQTVKKLFRDMLEKIGIKLDITDNDLRYLLWESRNNLRESANPVSVAKETTMRKTLGIGIFGKEPTEETRFRFEDRPQIIQQYDETIKSNAFRFQEAFQDSMLALKELQTLIENYSGKKIRTFENAYTAENRLSSVNKQDNEKYMKKYFEPLVEQIKKLSGSASREEVEDYIYAKSGLERNEVFLKRDADEAFNESKKELDAKLDKGDLTQDQYDALVKIAEADYQKAMSEPRDYSGLEGLVLKARQDELEGLDEKERAKKEKEIAKEYKQHAENVVSEFEAKIPAAETARLWQLINDATNETLRIQFDSGMISGERYDELKGMMKYYVPLKSWSEQIAEDVYEYTRREAPVQKEKAAKGRKSLAANPIANIALSAQNAIILGNRNKMKQRFFNFVINRPNPLATVSDVWYAKTIHTVHDQVEPVYPDINETDGAEEIQQKLEDFENEMKELEERGMAFRRKVPMGVELVMKKFQKPEHMVQVMINGQEYVIYINGNPRAAQAINGKTNPEGEENIFWEYYNKAKRLYGGGLTSNNPDFVIANFVRDSIHSATMEFMNNGLVASLNYLKNVPSSVKTVSRGVIGIYHSSNQMDVYFKEFVENGGETGYTAIHTLEDYKKEYEKLLQEVKGARKALKAGEKTLDAVISVLETANRIAEDINRFNAYVSSRQAGKTIEESIDAAKNITVNFNKKGSLGKGSGAWAALAWFMNKWILFFNPAVQGLYQVGQAAKKNKRRVQGTLGAVMASGFIMPYINSLLISAFGGGDDDDYFNQTDYTRMNNWLLFTGDGYVKIPLPPFFREWYGLGDILYRMLTGRMTPEKAAVATARQLQSLIGFINLIPSGEPSIAEAVAGLMPDLVAPLMDVALNRDFTGRDIAKDAEYTKNLPEYERIYKGVSPVYVSVSRMLNEIGGDEARRSPYFGTFINPAYMEHLVTSYTGGIGKTISNVVGMAADAVTGKTDNIEFRTVPVANRFYTPVTDRTVTSAINRIFYEYQDRYEAARVAEKRYKEFIKDGRKEFRKELEQMKKNGEADFISYFGAKMKILRKKQDRLRENPDDKRLEEEIRELKSQMIMRSKKLLE